MDEGTQECIFSLKRSIELDPENSAYMHSVGLVLYKLERNEEAIKYLEMATSLPNPHHQVFFDLGNTYRQAKDREGARRALADYKTLYDGYRERDDRHRRIEQLMNQANQHLEEGRVLEAVASFQRVIETDADHWQAHAYLAKIYLSSGRDYLAVPSIEKMLTVDPEASEGYFLMALYHYQRGDSRSALPHAEKSRELLPGNPQLRNLLGNIYVALGQNAKALVEYRAAVGLDPENPGFRMNYDSLAKR
jgi:Flp pilus assembly protein TadD